MDLGKYLFFFHAGNIWLISITSLSMTLQFSRLAIVIIDYVELMVLVLSDQTCSSLIELKSSTNAGSWQRHHWLSALIQCRLVSLWPIVQLTLWTQVIRFTSDWTLTVHYVVSEHYQLMVYKIKHHWLVSPKPIPASFTSTGTAARSLWIAAPVAPFSSATKLNSNGQLKQWSPQQVTSILAYTSGDCR